jgi:hypothetical protein
MPHIKIAEPPTDWEAPNSGDGPDESWKSLIVKTNANFAELFQRVNVLETTGTPELDNVSDGLKQALLRLEALENQLAKLGGITDPKLSIQGTLT